MWPLLLSACAGSGDADPRPPDEPVDDTSDGSVEPADLRDLFQGFVPKNVVVLHVDTLRWDHLPWYGYERDTFPLLSARPGWVRWERLYATSGWTAPSTSSLLTGLDVHHHGVRTVTEELHDTLGVPTLAEWYRDQGVATAFVSGNVLFDLPGGLTNGFDTVEIFEREPLNAAANTEAVLAAVDRLAPGTPFSVHVQPFDPHQPWYPGPAALGTWADTEALPFEVEAAHGAQQTALAAALADATGAESDAIKAAVIDLYDEELLGLDRALDALLVGLEERGLLADTLVVLTADHGETLFDRGDTYGHGRALYEEIVRLPLLFYNPAFEDRTYDRCLGSNMDLHPTILAAMGLPLPDGLDGRPLQEGCREVVTGAIYRESAADRTRMAMIQSTAQTVDHKLLRMCGLAEVAFDLRADPGSRDPTPNRDAPAFATLSTALDTVLADAQATWPDTTCTVPEAAAE